MGAWRCNGRSHHRARPGGVCGVGRAVNARPNADQTTTLRAAREHTTTTHSPFRSQHHCNSRHTAAAPRERPSPPLHTARAPDADAKRAKPPGSCRHIGQGADREDATPTPGAANAAVGTAPPPRRRTEVTAAPPRGTAAQHTAHAPIHHNAHVHRTRTRPATGRPTGATESNAAPRHR